MRFEPFIALRYLKAKRKQTIISIITAISILGVFIGVAALIIVLAVMSGFATDLRDKILGANSHLVVYDRGFGDIIDYGELIGEIEQVDGVVAAAPFIYRKAMMRSGSSADGILIKGITPRYSFKVLDLPGEIIEGDLSALDEPLSDDEPPPVVVGAEMAMMHGISIGSTIKIISPFGTVTPAGYAPKLKEFKVVGIFRSGMYEYDTTWVYTSIEAAQDFFELNNTVSGIEIKVNDIYKAKKIGDRILDKISYKYVTRDWMEMNRPFFSALKLEKIAMFIILLLIILVAAFGIISSQIMMVMEKYKDIGILKAMGATNKSIMKIFLYQGLLIGIVGTSSGMAVGIPLCLLADKYRWISLQTDVYYISHLPFLINPLEVFIIAASAIIISFVATIYPAWQASRLNPVEAIRYE